jgi:hypothetical protein
LSILVSDGTRTRIVATPMVPLPTF